MRQRNIKVNRKFIMKVALVHEFLNQFGGGERVLLALKELYPEADIFAILVNQENLPKQFDNFKIKTSFLQKWPDFLKNRHKLLLPFYPLAVEQLNLSSYDLIISDSSSFGKGILSRPDATHICYCHTPTGYLWHYSNEYLKEQRLSNFSKSIVKLSLTKLRVWDYTAAQRVDYFVANSKNVQKRIKKYYCRDSEVIYPPVDVSSIKSSHEKGDYFLIVSRLSTYKKIDLAIRVFNHLPKQKLKIIGTGSELDNLKQSAKSNTEFLGFQTDEDLKKYYSGCKALIFPAEEDFGITPVEAMAHGKPVIAYGEGGTKESIVEGKTGLFFDKKNPESLLECVNKFLKTENKFNPKTIQKHAQKFDKKIFQEKIKKFVNKVTKNDQNFRYKS
ncbi:MAG: glycosyltransferase [Candidatus Berkelbacteria bacterium]|nr:glycosyltransferase [Candidatus Berkelbacteria bacterium]